MDVEQQDEAVKGHEDVEEMAEFVVEPLAEP